MLDRPLTPWRASSAWDVVAPESGRFGAATPQAGVSLQPLDHVDLATLIAKEGRQSLLSDVVSRHFAFALPDAGRATFGNKGACIWSAPGQWLLVAPGAEGLSDLAGALKDIASVTDQGDGRALVRVSGPAARQALAKSVALDLHPDVFAAGHAAATAMAHVGVQIWVERDASSFLLAIPRSQAGSVWRCLTASAAEFGYTVLKNGDMGL